MKLRVDTFTIQEGLTAVLLLYYFSLTSKFCVRLLGRFQARQNR